MSSRSKRILQMAIENSQEYSAANIPVTVNESDYRTVLVPDDDLLMVLDNALGDNVNSISNCDLSNEVIDNEFHGCNVLKNYGFSREAIPTEQNSLVNECDNITTDAGTNIGVGEFVSSNTDITIHDFEGENTEKSTENVDIGDEAGNSNTEHATVGGGYVEPQNNFALRNFALDDIKNTEMIGEQESSIVEVYKVVNFDIDISEHNTEEENMEVCIDNVNIDDAEDSIAENEIVGRHVSQNKFAGTSFISNETDTEIIGGTENTDNFEAGRKETVMVKRKKTSQQRVSGERYIGYKRTPLKVISHNQVRDSRAIKDRCFHNLLPKKKTENSFMCVQITDEERKNIFDNFWKNLKTWPEKKAYIKGLVATRSIKRRRKENTGKRFKGEGHDMYLPTETGEKVRVCRTFFLNTIDLGRDTFMRWVKRNAPSASPGSSEKDEETAPVNVKHTTTPNKADKVKEWLDLLPKVPSHYCRASSTKSYVESTFRSYLHMYDVYKKWCTGTEVPPVGRMPFTSLLKKHKIAIHHPRKDQYDTCCGFIVGTVGNEEYTDHIKRKDDACAAKRAAKESANSEKLVITMDLQSVLVCPKTGASAMYYKQKLQVHNFTIYELNKGDVYLYVWHEANGGVSSNEFTSCIVHCISTVISEIYRD